MICARINCNHEFEERHGKRFCSRRCKELQSKSSLKERDPVAFTAKRQKRYYTKKAKFNKVCDCGNTYSTYKNNKVKCDACKASESAAKRYFYVKPIKHCKVCSSLVPHHRSSYCSESCSRIGSAKKPKMISCKVCNTQFRRLSSELHCSKECKQITEKARSRRRRNAITRTQTQTIDPILLFEKYNWQCAMCSKPTPRELIGTFHNDSPTIDHVIPLSLGGTHTYDNLQLLCQYCNCSVKRNNIIPSNLLSIKWVG